MLVTPKGTWVPTSHVGACGQPADTETVLCVWVFVCVWVGLCVWGCVCVVVWCGGGIGLWCVVCWCGCVLGVVSVLCVVCCVLCKLCVVCCVMWGVWCGVWGVLCVVLYQNAKGVVGSYPPCRCHAFMLLGTLRMQLLTARS